MPKTASWICLPGLDAAADDQAVRRVPASDDRSAALPERARQLAVHPDLGIIIERGFEDGRHARVSKSPTRAGMVMLMRYQLNQSRRCRGARRACPADHFPFRIVKLRAARVRLVIVGLDWRSSRLAFRAGGFEIDLDNFRVAITPLAFHQPTPSLVARLIAASGLPVGASALFRRTRGQRERRAPRGSRARRAADGAAGSGTVHRGRGDCFRSPSS